MSVTVRLLPVAPGSVAAAVAYLRVCGYDRLVCLRLAREGGKWTGPVYVGPVGKSFPGAVSWSLAVVEAVIADNGYAAYHQRLNRIAAEVVRRQGGVDWVGVELFHATGGVR